MTNSAGRMKAIETQAKRDALLGRNPANASHLGSAERTKYNGTYDAYKRK